MYYVKENSNSYGPEKQLRIGGGGGGANSNQVGTRWGLEIERFYCITLKEKNYLTFIVKSTDIFYT